MSSSLLHDSVLFAISSILMLMQYSSSWLRTQAKRPRWRELRDLPRCARHYAINLPAQIYNSRTLWHSSVMTGTWAGPVNFLLRLGQVNRRITWQRRRAGDIMKEGYTIVFRLELNFEAGRMINITQIGYQHLYDIIITGLDTMSGIVSSKHLTAANERHTLYWLRYGLNSQSAFGILWIPYIPRQ